MRKNTEPIFWLIWGTMAIAIVLFFAFALWPLQPIRIDEVKILNKGNTLKAGDHVDFRMYGFKDTDKPSKVIYQLVNDRVTTYTTVEGNLPRGTTEYGKVLPTSRGDIPGEYYMRVSMTTNYFGLRDVTVAKNSAPFQMKPCVPRGSK
jgi:hypothetical protein